MKITHGTVWGMFCTKPSMHDFSLSIPKLQFLLDALTDAFAQELKSLIQKAYPPSQRGSEEAEAIKSVVLINQSLSQLRPELKSKLAAQQASFDQLLARASFEENKLRDFGDERKWRTSSRTFTQGLSSGLLEQQKDPTLASASTKRPGVALT